KTRTGDAGISIRRRLATFHIDLFSNPKSLRSPHWKRSALSTHIHRIRAMAQWKAVTGATACRHKQAPCSGVHETT
ncbi:hypothetical protein M2310_007377, partial [Rhizobium leguminosarum]|nr:hypothetical protein [Rhizobium leguminosarum]